MRSGHPHLKVRWLLLLHQLQSSKGTQPHLGALPFPPLGIGMGGGHSIGLWEDYRTTVAPSGMSGWVVRERIVWVSPISSSVCEVFCEQVDMTRAKLDEPEDVARISPYGLQPNIFRIVVRLLALTPTIFSGAKASWPPILGGCLNQYLRFGGHLAGFAPAHHGPARSSARAPRSPRDPRAAQAFVNFSARPRSARSTTCAVDRFGSAVRRNRADGAVGLAQRAGGSNWCWLISWVLG